MATAAILTFDTRGIGRGLYTDVIPLAALGRLTMLRVSRIDWHEGRQRWEVKYPKGLPAKVLYHSQSREECIAWERENLAK
jgi:hypothetical protein